MKHCVVYKQQSIVLVRWISNLTQQQKCDSC